MTITLAAVYAPIGFVSGSTGSLFREFAFTLAGAVIVSGIIALTLSPMMCSKLLSVGSVVAAASCKFLDRTFERLKHRYQRRLGRTLNYRPVTLLVLVGVIAATVLDVRHGAEGAGARGGPGHPLQPGQDAAGRPTSTTSSRSPAISTTCSRRCRRRSTCSPSTAWAATCIRRSPAFCSSRGRSATARRQQILQDLQPKVNGIAGGQIITFGNPSLPGSTGGPPVQFVITTTADYEQLAQVLEKMQREAQKSGLFIFSDSDLKFDTPQIEVKIDHAKANSLGVTMQDIGASLATLLGGNYVNRFNLYGRSYQVIPQVPRDFRLTPDWIKRYQIKTSSGSMVPLSTRGRRAPERAAQCADELPAAQLRHAAGRAVPRPHRRRGHRFPQGESKEVFPEGFTYDFQGESRQYVQEGNASSSPSSSR